MAAAAMIIRNPYIVGNPIHGREMFFGREDDFQFLQTQFGGDATNKLVVFSGGRRSGKTSILFQVLDGRLGNRYLPVLFDMQLRAGVSSDEELFVSLAAAARNAAGCRPDPQDTLPAPVPAPAAASWAAAEIVDQMFDDVEQVHPEKVLLFLFDEYELIESKIIDGTLTALTVRLLAGILESNHRVCFIFAGSTAIPSRADCWRPLLAKSLHRRISYLSVSDTRRLITEPLKDAIGFPEGVVSKIYRLTAGQPFFVQVVCQNLIDVLIEENRVNPMEKDVDRVVDYTIDNPLPHMIYTWRSQPDAVKQILSAVATKLKTGRGWVDPLSANRFMRRSLPTLRLTVSGAHAMLEEAYHLDFLEKDRERYRYKMDLLRLWIAREHSIWSLPSGDEGTQTSITDRVPHRAVLSWLQRNVIFFVIGLMAIAAAIPAVRTILRRAGPPRVTILPFDGGDFDAETHSLLDGLSRAIAVNMHLIQGPIIAPYDPLSSAENNRSGGNSHLLQGTAKTVAGWFELRVALRGGRGDDGFLRTFRRPPERLLAVAVDVLRLIEDSFEVEAKGERTMLMDALEEMDPRSAEGYLRGLHYLDIREPGVSHTMLLRRLGVGADTTGLLFLSNRGRWGDIFETDPDNGNLRQVFDVISHGISTGPSKVEPTPVVHLSPDRKYWILQFAVPMPTGMLHVLDIESFFHKSFFRNVGVSYTASAWAPVGIHFAAERIGGGISIFTGDRDSRIEALRAEQVSESGRAPSFGAGGILAFEERDELSGESYIWVMPPKGKPSRLVRGVNPRFAPDGNRVAYYLGKPRQTVGIIDIRTWQESVIRNDSGWEFRELFWSPDGSRLVVEMAEPGAFQLGVEMIGEVSTHTTVDVGVVDVSSGTIANLTDHGGLDINPVWSPDGTRIAFQSYRDGNWDIYVVEVDGSSARNLTNHPADDVNPEW